MTLEYAKDVDCAYLSLKSRIADGKVARTVALSDSLLVDIGLDEQLLGIEFIDASSVLGSAPTETDAREYVLRQIPPALMRGNINQAFAGYLQAALQN